jgi:hypothetical protein
MKKSENQFADEIVNIVSYTFKILNSETLSLLALVIFFSRNHHSLHEYRFC